MRKLILVLLVLVGIGAAGPQLTLPWLPTLEWRHDTLHVTTSEKAWALDAKSWFPLIINDSGGYLLFRFDTETDTLTSIILNGGWGPWIPPVVIPASVDSIFLTAEMASTIYIEWYSE